ncbi:MAG TPA: hypothetical protein VI911_08005 [Patescibacteria group bacterium]|nr:hypothetical protein [Patescibacteria group bacterium]
MSSEMTKLRKEDLSLYHYLKEIVLVDFIEREENIPLEYIPEISSATSFVYEALTEMIPKPTARGRGWLYFDTVSGTSPYCYRGLPTREQSERVVVYDINGNIIDENSYIVDYVDGRIVTSGTVTPHSVDYYWHYAGIVDEWAAIQAEDPPVVVIDINGTDKTGYQLGGGHKDARKVDIHVFASSTSERNDIVEVIYNALYLKSIPLMDFPDGSVLDYDGTFYNRKYNLNKDTNLFDRSVVLGVSNLYFDNVTSRHVNLPLVMSRGVDQVMLSDLNAYRSKISLDMYSYLDGS